MCALLVFAQATGGDELRSGGTKGFSGEVGEALRKVRKGRALRGGGAPSSQFQRLQGPGR